MKKILPLLLALCLFTTSYGQIHLTGKEENVKSFKETETIFVLSDIYDSETYNKILKDTWTVTPYKVVKASAFNLGDYLDGKHSFAMLELKRTNIKRSNIIYEEISHYIRFFLFENEKKKKELAKFNEKSPAKQKKYDLYEDHIIPVGTIRLYPNSEFSERLGSAYENTDIRKTMYNEDAFYNYNRGFLKNYFQKMSSRIYNVGPDKLGGDDCTPELKNLKKQTLYIPSYVTKYCGDNYSEEKEKEDLKDFFNEYKYPFDIIDTDELDAKIISGEEFYYLRFFKDGGYKLLEIINSKTGEIVYRCHQPRANFITLQHIKDIKVSIDTGKV